MAIKVIFPRSISHPLSTISPRIVVVLVVVTFVAAWAVLLVMVAIRAADERKKDLNRILVSLS